MKATLLKMIMITTMVIFLFAGAAWADHGKNRHRHQFRHKPSCTDYDRQHGYHDSSHHKRGWYEHPRRHHKKHHDRHLAVHRAERHYFKHHRNDHRWAHKHRHQHHYRHHGHYRDHGHYHHKQKAFRKHYHKHKRSYNVFSYRTSDFGPGWSIAFKTKSRW